MKAAIGALVLAILAGAASAQLTYVDPVVLTLDPTRPNELVWYVEVKEQDLHHVPAQYKEFVNRTLSRARAGVCLKEVP